MIVILGQVNVIIRSASKFPNYQQCVNSFRQINDDDHCTQERVISMQNYENVGQYQLGSIIVV